MNTENTSTFKLPETWEEVCKITGDDPVLSLPHPDPQTPKQKSTNAFHVLTTAIEVINESKIPDHSDSSTYKYEPRWWHKPGVGLSLRVCDYCFTISAVGPRLSFNSPEKLYHTCDKFYNWYKDMFNEINPTK
jgi:hypothetical protein